MNTTEILNYCLWLELLGNCSEYINNELSVFNIWVFLWVIWVFFAGIQLVSGIQKIRFEEMNKKWYFYIFLTIPIITVLIGTVLPFIPWSPVPLLWYPIFWEIFTAVYIIIFLIVIVIRLTRKIKKFSKWGGMNRIYLNYIAQNKQLDNLANELQYFFEDFLDAYKEEGKNKEWWYGSQFLVIIQNQRLINDIIINPFVIQKIIEIYQKDTRKHFTYEEQQFLQKIFFSSFSDNNSHLASELWWEFNINPRSANGILLWKIIEDLSFLEKLHLVWDGRTYQYDQDIVFAKNYLNFTAKIHEEFRNKEKIKKNYKFHQLLFDTFKTQANIIWKNFKNLDYIQLRNLLWSNFEYDLWELEQSLLVCYNGKFPEVYLNQKRPYRWEHHYLDSNKSLLDAYAFGIFELFKAFAWKKEDTRNYTIDFNFLRNEDSVLKEIEKRLLILFKQIIPDNLDGHYATLSRIFWDNYSWDILNTTELVDKNNHLMDIICMYAQKLPRLAGWYIYTYYTDETLKDSYKKEKALEKSREIIADLFPKYIDYDNENNLLNIYDLDRLSFRSIDLWKTLSNRRMEIIW